jgi:hypothetical protein
MQKQAESGSACFLISKAFRHCERSEAISLKIEVSLAMLGIASRRLAMTSQFLFTLAFTSPKVFYLANQPV